MLLKPGAFSNPSIYISQQMKPQSQTTESDTPIFQHSIKNIFDSYKENNYVNISKHLEQEKLNNQKSPQSSKYQSKKQTKSPSRSPQKSPTNHSQSPLRYSQQSPQKYVKSPLSSQRLNSINAKQYQSQKNIESVSQFNEKTDNSGIVNQLQGQLKQQVDKNMILEKEMKIQKEDIQMERNKYQQQLEKMQLVVKEIKKVQELYKQEKQENIQKTVLIQQLHEELTNKNKLINDFRKLQKEEVNLSFDGDASFKEKFSEILNNDSSNIESIQQYRSLQRKQLDIQKQSHQLNQVFSIQQKLFKPEQELNSSKQKVTFNMKQFTPRVTQQLYDENKENDQNIYQHQIKSSLKKSKKNILIDRTQEILNKNQNIHENVRLHTDPTQNFNSTESFNSNQKFTDQIEIVTAKIDYKPQKDKDLEFQKGDKIQILKKVKNGYWIGMCKNQIGYFPQNYIQE